MDIFRHEWVKLEGVRVPVDLITLIQSEQRPVIQGITYQNGTKITSLFRGGPPNLSLE